jgi:hypothetical protein
MKLTYKLILVFIFNVTLLFAGNIKTNSPSPAKENKKNEKSQNHNKQNALEKRQSKLDNKAEKLKKEKSKKDSLNKVKKP